MDRFEIDESWWRIFYVEVKYCGKPLCEVCRKELKNGDFIDHYFPDYQERNICASCLKED